jgi:hypothetical protein
MASIGSASIFEQLQAGTLNRVTRLVNKYGRNPAVPNGSWGDMCQVSAFYWPTTAAAVRVKAGGNAADDADAGAGAREVTISGLDDTGALATEAVATAGEDASDYTTTTFLRVNRAWVSSSGAYGAANTAAITIEDGSNDLITIAATEGQTQFCAYTIPTGMTGYLLSAHITVDAAKAADVRIFTRENATDTTVPVSPQRLKYFFDGVLGYVPFKPAAPALEMAALTDIWVEAYGGGAQTEVSAVLQILLVE